MAHVQHPTPSRNSPRPFIHSRHQLRIMLAASSALLSGGAPALTADELAEAGALLEALDRDPVDIPYQAPFDDDDEPDSERPDRDLDELLDMRRDLAADRRRS